MSFLKDFKDDLSQAMNELVDENTNIEASENTETDEDEMVDTLDLDAINDVLNENGNMEEQKETAEDDIIPDIEDIITEVTEDNNEENEEPQEELIPQTVEHTEVKDEAHSHNDKVVASDEVAEITKGTTITGNIDSTGSINVFGKVIGDISCLGKASVTGTVVGKTKADEVYANNAKIEGNIESDGCVKIGNGSIIIGSISATSAVIGGAVKGDIDVKGPVIVDATAVVKGDIRSRSVQINNGAVIDGRCSQCYADIDFETLFDETFAK